MNTYFALFFLGLVQGLTEFLPVSSSGHLVLFSAVFGVEESLEISILLHVATLFSILVVFRKEVWHMIRHPLCKEAVSLVVATIPTCIIVLLLMPLVKMSFSGAALPLCFLLSALLLAFSQAKQKKAKFSCQKISNKTAFFMGIAQGFAVFPGISRSGATISVGLICNASKADTAKFSFLMSIPIVALSLLLEIYDLVSGAIVFSIDLGATILAFFTAFLAGIFAIKLMIKLTEKANLAWFSLYLVAVAILSFFVI